ncbi:YbhB/YbcL family Raf kinase inhibitor-like protein [Actinoplanes bogorensis]|uniref:YbhB/YbcL family Raf kinase inhibitor-like protein n=1 Tax=Paractinoplanes bogorensis TaxID=1610840 RepID=A0ABS5YUB4_9ACTN|nr:YbhB/YbcL family Raf kinase inhibitor-like protein [Actinoplanes bogorensis]MBU2667049.1 YbhB/YbcL family Raf kinase inhibitor-like protein [Actinoplanes bogorensis]
MNTENNPFARLPQVPSFELKSTAATEGEPLPPAQMSGAFGIPGGLDLSPDLAWSGAPEGTRSYAVTVYDPDAPTMSGFWHWAVVNIPATVTELPAGAGSALPAGAITLPNDARLPQYIGAAPPAGHGPHRYFITVHALDVADIGVPADSTPALLGFTMTGHILGRATIVATAETPAAR